MEWGRLPTSHIGFSPPRALTISQAKPRAPLVPIRYENGLGFQMFSSLAQTHLKTSPHHPAPLPISSQAHTIPFSQICRIRGKSNCLSSPNSLCSLASPGSRKEKGQAGLGWRCHRGVPWPDSGEVLPDNHSCPLGSEFWWLTPHSFLSWGGLCFFWMVPAQLPSVCAHPTKTGEH